MIDKKEPLFQFSEEELDRQLLSAELKNQNRQLATGDLNDSFLIQQLPTADLENEWIELFLKVPFTQHRLIIRGAEVTEERVFYIQKVATELWSFETLKHHLKSDLYQRQGKLAHNFQSTLSENAFRQKALMAFKDEMLLDFINIEDADEEPNERVLENAIVQNIKKFILHLLAEVPNQIDKVDFSDEISGTRQIKAMEKKNDQLGRCPKCKKGIVMLYPKIATCLNPECDFKLWPTVAKKKLTKTNLRDLLSKGKTSKVVKGFTGKKGKFDAVLVLKEDMTIGFSFPWIENSGTKAVDGNKETSRKNNENEVE